MSFVVPVAMGAGGVAAGFLGYLRLRRLLPKKAEAAEKPAGNFLVRQSWKPSSRIEDVVAWVVRHAPADVEFTTELYHGAEEAHLERHFLDEMILAALFIVTAFLSLKAALGR